MVAKIIDFDKAKKEREDLGPREHNHPEYVREYKYTVVAVICCCFGTDFDSSDLSVQRGGG